MNLRTFVQGVCEKAGWPREERRDGALVVTVVLPEGRKQEVAIASYEEDGNALVRLTTRIGPVTSLSPEKAMQALRMNAELRFGAFAIANDELVLTDSVLAMEWVADELELSLRYLARRADMAEKFLFGADVR